MGEQFVQAWRLSLICALLNLSCSQTSPISRYNILKSILEAPEQEFRARIPPADQVNVSCCVEVIKLYDLEESTETLSVLLQMRLQWKDDLLSWNSLLYGNVSEITVPNKYIWTPNVRFRNLVTEPQTYLSDLSTNAVIKSNGDIVRQQFLQISFECPLNFKYYPFDSQECELDLQLHNLCSEPSAISLFLTMSYNNSYKYNLDNPTWIFQDASFKYDLSSGKEDSLLPTNENAIVIRMKRRVGTGTIFVLLPVMVLNSILLMQFSLELGCKEKMALDISAFIGLILYISCLAWGIPYSRSTSYIIYFTLMSIIEALTGLVINVLLIDLNYSHVNNWRIPMKLIKLVLKRLSRLLCFKNLWRDTKRVKQNTSEVTLIDSLKEDDDSDSEPPGRSISEIYGPLDGVNQKVIVSDHSQMQSNERVVTSWEGPIRAGTRPNGRRASLNPDSVTSLTSVRSSRRTSLKSNATNQVMLPTTSQSTRKSSLKSNSSPADFIFSRHGSLRSSFKSSSVDESLKGSKQKKTLPSLKSRSTNYTEPTANASISTIGSVGSDLLIPRKFFNDESQDETPGHPTITTSTSKIPFSKDVFTLESKDVNSFNTFFAKNGVRDITGDDLHKKVTILKASQLANNMHFLLYHIMKCIDRIRDTMDKNDELDMRQLEWHGVATVLNRFFFYVYFFITLVFWLYLLFAFIVL